MEILYNEHNQVVQPCVNCFVFNPSNSTCDQDKCIYSEAYQASKDGKDIIYVKLYEIIKDIEDSLVSINRQEILDELDERCKGAKSAYSDCLKMIREAVIEITDKYSDTKNSQTSEWIPIKNPDELPKDRMLWVTIYKYGFPRVDKLHWDMTEWSDPVDHVVAYMDYKEPEPYENN